MVRSVVLLFLGAGSLNGLELRIVEKAITIPGAVRKFAEDNLSYKEIDKVLQRRRKEGGSSRFVEQEALLAVLKNRVNYHLSGEFYTDHSFPETRYAHDGRMFQVCSIREWRERRIVRERQLTKEIRGEVEKELKRYKKDTRLKNVRIAEASGQLKFMKRRTLKCKKPELPDCSICLSPMQSAVKTTGCFNPHLFHQACVSTYLRHEVQKGVKAIRCPLCRAPFNYSLDIYTLKSGNIRQ